MKKEIQNKIPNKYLIKYSFTHSESQATHNISLKSIRYGGNKKLY